MADPEKLPPQDLEAERSVLGSILLDNDVLHEIVPILGVNDFYRDVHQTIYRAIRDLYDMGKGIDAITLADELIKRDQWDKIGGGETVTEIVNSVPHAAEACRHARVVLENSLLRRVIDASTMTIRDAYSRQYTAEEVLQLAEQRVFAIADGQLRGDRLELKDAITPAMDAIAARAEAGGHAITGVGTGLIDLDDITGGFQPGQLVIVGGRPSMGKTALALGICDHAAMNQDISVLYVSLELGRREIAERLLRARSRIDGYKLRTGMGLGNSELTLLAKAFNELSKGAPIFIDDTPRGDVLRIASTARRLRIGRRIGLIVVDYLTLMGSVPGAEGREEHIAAAVRELKGLARELEIPVIALSQVSRSVESREDRCPRMADLRASGAIEEDADVVLLLHRPDYYDSRDHPGLAWLYVAKNRNGRTRAVPLSFVKAFGQFCGLSAASEESPADPGHVDPTDSLNPADPAALSSKSGREGIPDRRNR